MLGWGTLHRCTRVTHAFRLDPLTQYVDEVIIGAPYTVTSDVLEKVFHVDVVVHGKTDVLPDLDGSDPYALAKERGIYVQVETPYSAMSTDTIIERIVQNRKLYEARNRRKQEKAREEERLLMEERRKNAAAAATSTAQK